jgi:hypothetical protein
VKKLGFAFIYTCIMILVRIGQSPTYFLSGASGIIRPNFVCVLLTFESVKRFNLGNDKVKSLCLTKYRAMKSFALLN